MAEMLADNLVTDDRRRVVGAGVRHGRDAQIADMRAIADLRNTNLTSTVIATRGERLVLASSRLGPRSTARGVSHGGAQHRRDQRRRAVRRVRHVRPDDIDAAFEELDTRYLAGEAAAYAHTWSVVAGLCRVQPARAPRDDAGLGDH